MPEKYRMPSELPGWKPPAASAPAAAPAASTGADRVRRALIGADRRIESGAVRLTGIDGLPQLGGRTIPVLG